VVVLNGDIDAEQIGEHRQRWKEERKSSPQLFMLKEEENLTT